MKQQTRNHMVRLAAGLALLAGIPDIHAENAPEARFHGAPTYDFGVTNVTWEAGTKDYSWVTFDLYWSYSWRAKWVEPAEKNVTGKPLEVENWDAAWVFVKFLPEKDSTKSIERNHWQHAILAPDASQHVMPVGATNTVGLADDPSTELPSPGLDADGAGASRGLGVFIYRDAIGHGVNDYKGVKLRWLHAADPSGKVDPARAAIAVHAISMVYVPEGAFKVGSGQTTRIDPFPDGPTLPILQGQVGDELGSFTDGSWRGGPIVPFLVDAEWNGPAAEGTRARRIGAVAGQLWGRVGYTQHCSQYWQMPHSTAIGSPGALNDDYPTGYNAFYCMKYELTQGQYAAYLNALPPDVAAARASVPVGVVYVDPKKPYSWESAGNTITALGITRFVPKPKQVEVGSREMADLEFEKVLESLVVPESGPKAPPIYTARVPQRTCNFLAWQDGFAYAGWAGMRPMTELEFEKVCRGPLNPVPGEHAWGSTAMILATNLLEAGMPTERYEQGNGHSLYWRDSGAMVTRAGIFATPDSDRVSAGASYWGILEMEIATFAIPMATTNGRAFRGSHGDGSIPGGAIPGPSVPSDWTVPGGRMGLVMSHRTSANTPAARPPTYPGRGSGQRVWCSCWRGVRSAAPRETGAKPKPAPAPAAKPATALADAAHDEIKVANTTWDIGANDGHTVTFDLSWDNSWRAKWEEPSEKNVTGKPLTLESWDAAWVFVKVLTDTNAKNNFWRHATLDTDASRHQVPAGAALDVGLDNSGANGVGVFIYRDTPGSGPVAFRNVRLSWMHDADEASGKDVQLRVHAIPMVYVPQGPFKSKGPWGHPLTSISNSDTTKAGGYRVGQAVATAHFWGPEHVARLMRVRLEAGTAPKHAAWPNGYKAFYCMKYSITQGQYADFLNALPADRANKQCPTSYNINRFTIRRVADKGAYAADAPDQPCNFLSWSGIWSYTAWAGLRPITDLEYEKASRGPREVARDADAWSAAACAPFDGAPFAPAPGKATAGLDDAVGTERNAAGSPPSYWGIRELSLSGIPFEWPQVIRNEPGFNFKGTHGEGVPEWPSDWPAEGPLGDIYEDAFGWGFMIGFWVAPSDMGLIQEARDMWADRTGRYGVHAARTAPVMQNEDSPLQVNPVPSLIGSDVGVFYLSGRFRNDANKPLKVELTTSLPDACFPDGAVSRAFMAAPKAVTPFKVLTVVTRQTAAGVLGGGRMLPIRIRAVDGDVLAEKTIQVLMTDSKNAKPPVIGSFEGGSALLRITNLTDRAFTLAVRMLSAAIKLAETNRNVTVAAGATMGATFAVQRQGFINEGVYRLPFTIAVANSAPQNAEAVVELRPTSHWWISRRIEARSKAAGDGAGPGDLDDMGDMGDALGLADIVNYDGTVFKAATPPKGWERATYGAGISFGDAGKLPSHGSSMQAATRVESPGDRDAILEVLHETDDVKARFDFTVWFNDTVVFKPAKDATEKPTSFRIRKTGNTMIVECRSFNDRLIIPGKIILSFKDAENGKPVSDLLFDMEKR